MIKTNKQIWQRDKEECRAFDTHTTCYKFILHIYTIRRRRKKEQREETLLRMIYF